MVFASCLAVTTFADGTKYMNRSPAEWEKALQEGSPQLRNEAFAALTKGDGAAVPVLIELLGNSNRSMHGVAAIGLAKQGEPRPQALPALTRAMGNPETNVRYWAAKALAAYGTFARPALPALHNAYKTCVDGNPGLKGPPRFVTDCRAAVIGAMAVIDPAASQQTLREALNDPAQPVRDAATAALAKVKPQ